MQTFRVPRFDAPLDLEAHVRLLPRDASCRGMFLADIVEHASERVPSVDLPAAAGVPSRRYVPFFEYPYADLLRLMHAAAAAVHPELPRGEGLRRIGQRAYPKLLESHAGRVIFGVLGVDVGKVFEYGPKGYRVTINFGKVTSARVGDRHFTYTFAGLPGFLETYQVGVLEGALLHYGCVGELRVALHDLAHATLDIRWD